MDLPFGIDHVDEALGQPGVAMLADAGQMVDDFVRSLDLPQSAALMPRLTARIAIRFAAHASRALTGDSAIRCRLPTMPEKSSGF